MFFVAYVIGCSNPEDVTSAPVSSSPSTPEVSVPEAPDPGSSVPDEVPSYWADVQPILAENCVDCHRDGDVAPFSLETAAQAIAWAEAIRQAVVSRAMPPWPPSDDCLPLQDSRTLTEDEIATIGAWVDAGAPEGDPADAVEIPERDVFGSDLRLPMAEPYTPRAQADDYRCFLVDWPLPEAAYVTGYEVEPGQRDLVHHVILSTATDGAAAQARALDEDSPGPGYDCFGSTGVLGTETVGAWVPGVRGIDLPEGTGIRVAPGATVIVQVHYNTTTNPAPAPDLSELGFRIAETVDKPAAALLVTNPLWLFAGMDIPAGDPSVIHDTRFTGASLAQMAGSIGAAPDEPLVIHRIGLHMHLLGRRALLTLERADGERSCAMDIPEWDFHWQGSYALDEPLVLGPDDALHLACEWDNSGPDAVDTSWGEGTSDEMCLAGMYVTR